jgi:hypothetical protein
VTASSVQIQFYEYYKDPLSKRTTNVNPAFKKNIIITLATIVKPSTGVLQQKEVLDHS